MLAPNTEKAFIMKVYDDFFPIINFNLIGLIFT